MIGGIIFATGLSLSPLHLCIHNTTTITNQHSNQQNNHVGERQGRTRRKKVHDVVGQGRPTIPRGPYRSIPTCRQVRLAHGGRRAGIPRGRTRVPVCRNTRTGRQCRARQQEGAHRATTHHVGGEERRGAQQIVGRGNHRERRCPPEHTRRATAQEKRRREQERV